MAGQDGGEAVRGGCGGGWVGGLSSISSRQYNDGGFELHRSSVSSKFDGISSLVVGSTRGSRLGIEVALHAQTSAGLAGGGDSSQLSVLLVGSGDPVDSGVVADGVVGGVDEDDLEVFVGSVLGDPVAVEDSESAEGAADSLLGLGPEVSAGLELVDTHGGGLAGDDTLGDGSLPASSSDSDSVDDVAVLGLEAEFAGLVGSAGLVDAGDDGQLSVLPGADSEDEVHQVGLFLSPQFLQVLVGSHMVNIYSINQLNKQLIFPPPPHLHPCPFGLLQGGFNMGGWDNQSFIIKIKIMNKFKTSTSQLKVKTKMPLPSPVNKKSLSKTKDKIDRPSPRANRIHTLEAKKSIEVPKRPKMTINTEQNLKDPLSLSKAGNKGYETPKFKWEMQQAKSHKATQAMHNFFSFGEMEPEKDEKRRWQEKEMERNKENILRAKDLGKQGKMGRKEGLYR